MSERSRGPAWLRFFRRGSSRGPRLSTTDLARFRVPWPLVTAASLGLLLLAALAFRLLSAGAPGATAAVVAQEPEAGSAGRGDAPSRERVAIPRVRITERATERAPDARHSDPVRQAATPRPEPPSPAPETSLPAQPARAATAPEPNPEGAAPLASMPPAGGGSPAGSEGRKPESGEDAEVPAASRPPQTPAPASKPRPVASRPEAGQSPTLAPREIPPQPPPAPIEAAPSPSVPARPLPGPPPQPPRAAPAAKRDLAGEDPVEVRVTVGPQGRARSAVVVRSSGDARRDARAVQEALRRPYRPPRREESEISVEVSGTE